MLLSKSQPAIKSGESRFADHTNGCRHSRAYVVKETSKRCWSVPVCGEMVRQVIGKFLIVLLVLGITTIASLRPLSAGETVVMPFSCKLKDGKPTLASAAPTHHEIEGARQQRSYTACLDGAGRDCRTMMVHSFKLRCEGTPVPWWKIAAQVRSKAVGRSWIEDGRLNLLLTNRTASDSTRMSQFVLPPGYAPVGELGARLAIQPDKPTKTASTSTTSKKTKPLSTASVNKLKSDRVAATSKSAVVDKSTPKAETVPTLLDNRPIIDPWQPVVHHTDTAKELAGATANSGYGLSALLAGLVATSLIAAFGWFMRQRHGLAVSSATSHDETTGQLATPRLSPIASKASAWYAVFPSLLSGIVAKVRARWFGWKWRNVTAAKPWEWRNTSIANGARSAEALFGKAEIAVRALGPVSALRDTLTSELKVVRHRLDALRDGAGEDVRTARLASSLRSAVRDLERIGRIADSAASSLKNGRDDRTMPKTRAEAYELLGVNPNASEASLKRTVDALRMGWHPDHAKDEADKCMREERTKQINIAWDLIVGKRAA